MYLVETFIVKPDKVIGFSLPHKFRALIKSHPELFTEMKSWNVYQHTLGIWGEFIEFTEFENYADFEKWMAKTGASPEGSTLWAEFFDLLVPGSYRQAIVENLGRWSAK